MEEEDKIKEEEIKEEEDGATPAPSEEKVELTAEPDPSETQKKEESEEEEEVKEESEPTLTQSQVNAIMAKTREEARERARQELLKEIYERYGVNSDDELNGIFGKGQAYDVLNDDFATQGNELKSMRAENALLKSGIAQNRWDDARAILTAKGLDVTEDNILSELQTHPEWNADYNIAPEKKEFTVEMGEKLINQPRQESENPGRIRKLGMQVDDEYNEDNSEEDKINKIFGI